MPAVRLDPVLGAGDQCGCGYAVLGRDGAVRPEQSPADPAARTCQPLLSLRQLTSREPGRPEPKVTSCPPSRPDKPWTARTTALPCRPGPGAGQAAAVGAAVAAAVHLADGAQNWQICAWVTMRIRPTLVRTKSAIWRMEPPFSRHAL